MLKESPGGILRHIKLALALAVGLSPLASAQSADKILSQHVSALGGAKILKPLATVEYRGEAREQATGDRASFTLTIHAPNLIYIELAAVEHGWSEADNGPGLTSNPRPSPYSRLSISEKKPS